MFSFNEQQLFYEIEVDQADAGAGQNLRKFITESHLYIFQILLEKIHLYLKKCKTPLEYTTQLVSANM